MWGHLVIAAAAAIVAAIVAKILVEEDGEENKGRTRKQERKRKGQKGKFQKLEDTQTNFGNRRVGHEISKIGGYLI